MIGKSTNRWFAILTVLLLIGGTVQAQVLDFEEYEIGTPIATIGWGTQVAEIAADPLAAGNKVLKFTPNNYNSAPVLEFTLPDGKTLADYPTFSFKGYFQQGDIGWKDIVVEAYQTAPAAQAFNNAAAKVGSWNRAAGASAAWEEITIDIAGSADMTGTIYIAFGINCAATGDQGGAGSTTIWYADDADLGIELEPPIPTTGLISTWGSIGRYGWPIVPGEEDGSAGMGSDTYPQGAWATLRGGFDLVAATETEAVVATGKLEFLGDGATSWSALRYGIFRHDSSGTLINAGTDSARWTGRENYAYGYMFSPRSGTNDQVSGQGGNGTQWMVNGGTWLSTWSGGTMTMGVVNPAPARAEITMGVYEWAFSVRPLGDGTNEVKWFLMKEDKSYWFGGTAIDTMGVTTSFNGVVFGINNGNGIENTDITGLKITEAQVELGAPIVVPEKPWQAYYIDDWGTLGGRWGNWKLQEGDFIGDVSMSGDAPPSGSWASVRGGFVEPLDLTTEKAVIVRGMVQFVGDDLDTWGPIRYGFFYHDSVGTLQIDSTQAIAAGDSFHYNLAWSGKENLAHGYMFSPQSGTNDLQSGQGGNGTQWAVNGGSPVSTWSGGTMTMGVVKPAPARAKLTEGTYNFAMSVHDLGDGTNEVRFYLYKQFSGEQTTYWFGGTVIDTMQVTTKINGFYFAKNPGNGAELTEITGYNLMEVQVDYGDPIEVPEAPWEAYYVTDWGILGSSHGWKLVPGEFDGDAGMGNSGPPTGWEGLYGQFPDPVVATPEKAVIVSGEIEFLGAGPTSWSPFRYALFYNDSAKTLINAGTDSALFAGGKANPVYGYEMTPRSGITDQISGQGGLGNLWSVKGGGYNSTWSGGNRTMGVFPNAPARAEMTVGVYEWAISIQPQGDGTNEVRWYIQKKIAPGQKQTTFWQGGIAIDDREASTKFNAVAFAINNNVPAEMTGIRVYMVQVDKGDPIDLPDKPWEAYYVDAWGISGGNTGGWDLTIGDFVGDASVGGMTAPTGWAAVRGGFIDPYELSPVADRALLVSGQIELVGGGFEDLASLRFGVFYSDSAGTPKQDANLDSNWVWSGTDRAHSGYLFVPPSGENFGPSGEANLANWSGEVGTWGAIVDGAWWDITSSKSFPLGTQLQAPANAVAGPGTYNFAISVSPHSAGNLVKATLQKVGGGYYYEVSSIFPVVKATNKFNCVAFAINNSTTTAMNLIEVQIDRGLHITTDVEAEGSNQPAIPTAFSLSQNYPNPFNPTTTMEISLPKRTQVKLVVYDALGKVVAELMDGTLNAGVHQINFNAANLSTGVYFYKLTAGEFTSIKKLMLLK